MTSQFSFEETSSYAIEEEFIHNKSIHSNYSSNPRQNTSWTNLRVQQIKRKYDTSSSHSKISNNSKNQSQQSILSNQKLRLPLGQKSNIYLNAMHQPTYHKNQYVKPTKIIQKLQQDQTVVFHKIQKMKELINEKKKFGKVVIQKQKAYYNLKELTNRESIDPRIKNIDKINNKIKHILQCLHENQNQNLLSKNNSIILQKNNLQFQFYQKKPEQFQPQNNQIQHKLKKSIQTFHISQFLINNQKANQQNNAQNKQLNIRSKSCFQGYNFPKQNKVSTNNQFLKNKKINQKIEKIQSRIKKFQVQKKRLNIEFKAYQKHNRSITNISENQSPKSIIFRDLSKINIKENEQVQNFEFQLSIPIRNLNINNSNCNSQQHNRLKYNYLNLKISQQNQQQKFQNYKESMNNQKLKIKTKQGIQNRRKMLQLGDQISQKSEEVERLINSFVKQVQLDQYLRNSKIWLDNCTINKKYQKINQQLKKQNTHINYHQTLSQFCITQDENNPFYTLRQNASTIQNTVKVYLKAKKHWQQKILRQFNQQKLKRINFINEKLDMQRKGYLCINDIVRFLNMEGGKFFRNRDVVLIWRRISTEETIKNEYFYKIIC